VLGSSDCDVWATPESFLDGDVVDVEVDAVDATETIIENGSAFSHPLQLLTFTVRVANGSKKVGFVLTQRASHVSISSTASTMSKASQPELKKVRIWIS